MRILVVDDEMVSRAKMQRLMQAMGDCQVAENGTQGIQMYSQAFDDGNAYELVLLDIEMPDMPGTQVLQHIRNKEKEGSHQAAIIMVTAQSDEDNVLDCIQGGCNDYITKPFTKETIQQKLAKMGLVMDEFSAKAVFEDINEGLRTGKLKLPVIPQIGIKFKEMVQNNAGVSELANLLKQDITVSSSLIRTANSAVYRGYGKSKTVEQAIARIGVKETEQMVMIMSIANQEIFMVEDQGYRKKLSDIWRHSLACAYGSEILADSLFKKLAIDPFTSGLLHDIGALILICIVAEMDKRGRYANGVNEVELFDMVESNHSVFGAKLMELWAFDHGYIRIALYHDNLHAADPVTDELLVVHFANLMVKDMGYKPYARDVSSVDLLSTPYAGKLGVEQHQIGRIQQYIETKMAELDQWME